jgi:hypothetical protein
VVRGPSTFEWREGKRFLIQRSVTDHIAQADRVDREGQRRRQHITGLSKLSQDGSTSRHDLAITADR